MDRRVLALVPELWSLPLVPRLNSKALLRGRVYQLRLAAWEHGFSSPGAEKAHQQLTWPVRRWTFGCDSSKILLSCSPQQLCLSACRGGTPEASAGFGKVSPTVAVFLKKQQENHILFT